MDKKWWYVSYGKRAGPVSGDEISELIKTGLITARTRIWQENGAGWIYAGDSEWANRFVTQPPPVAPEDLKNFFAWNLAFCPLYFFFLNLWGFYGFFLSGNMTEVYYFIVLAANIAFLWLDHSYLVKSGYHIGRWGWLGIVFVPVYLFIRASATDKNYIIPILNLFFVLLTTIIPWFWS